MRPDIAEFMGEVAIDLDLPTSRKVTAEKTLKLISSMDLKEAQGTITVQYEWNPDGIEGRRDSFLEDDRKVTTSSTFPTLQGSLKLCLIGADNLRNHCWQRGKKCYSNPYCLVFLYPVSPEAGKALQPCCWRSPTCKETLNPRWGTPEKPEKSCSREFVFNWVRDKQGSGDSADPQDAAKLADMSPASVSSSSRPERKADMEDEVLVVLNSLTRDIRGLRDEVNNLNGRIDRSPAASGSPSQPVVPDEFLTDQPGRRKEQEAEVSPAPSRPMSGTSWANKDRPVLPHMMDHEDA